MSVATHTSLLRNYTSQTGARPAGWAQYCLLAVTAAAMGMQASAVKEMGLTDVSTTFLTGTLTALVSSLVSPGLAEKLVGATSASGSASGTPSSSSPNQSDSSSQSGGMPLGGMTQSSPSSSASSNPSFGQFTLPNNVTWYPGDRKRGFVKGQVWLVGRWSFWS